MVVPINYTGVEKTKCSVEIITSFLRMIVCNFELNIDNFSGTTRQLADNPSM